MDLTFVIKEGKDGRKVVKRAELLEDVRKARAVLHETRWKILQLLAEKPRHALEIARILKEHEQKIYYHIRQLENAGIIELHRKVERHGTIAKLYSVKSGALVLDLPAGDEEPAELPLVEKNRQLIRFLYPHVVGGKINTTIVVGSPDPHGPYQVRARDVHYAAEIAFLLGQYASSKENFIVKLDVDVKAEKNYDGNMILVGGVLTNIITQEMNHHLPVRFDMESFPFRRLISTITSRTYEEENVGIVAKIPNPYNPEKSVMVLAGNRHAGTKAAVLALTKYHEEILENYDGEDVWSRVVRGLDLDGDGKVDSIEIIE